MSEPLDPVAINVRLATLEVEMEHTKSALEKNTDVIENMSKKVEDINLYIQKQNGAIPHMQADLNELKTHLYSFTTKYFDATVADTREEAQSDTKIKIIWSVLVAVGTGLLGFVLKSLLG
jgi:uncharacterized coiled-coil DUF342 family protein